MLHFEHLQPRLPQSRDERENRLSLQEKTAIWWRAFLPHLFGAFLGDEMPVGEDLEIAIGMRLQEIAEGQYEPSFGE